MKMEKQCIMLLILLGLLVLDWFFSYLSNRSQKVTADGILSDRFSIDFGVPRGSSLGPLLFVIYSSKLFNIVIVIVQSATPKL